MQEKTKKNKQSKRAGYIASVVVNGIIIFILNYLPNWDIPFITKYYSNCLWAINLSLGATIIANFIFIFYNENWFLHLLQVFTSITAFIAFYVINEIFPFAFEGDIWYTLLRVFLIAGMVISILSAIYNIIRTALPFRKKHNERVRE